MDIVKQNSELNKMMEKLAKDVEHIVDESKARHGQTQWNNDREQADENI